jgi:diaminopimelate epimerase
VLGEGRLSLAVYERGAGWTEACGTGACAAAVAAVETGRAARGKPLQVELPGGALTIVVPAVGERVLMTGPARHVFDGSVTLD